MEREVGGKRLNIDRGSKENAAGFVQAAVGQFQEVPESEALPLNCSSSWSCANPELKSKGWFGCGTPTLTPCRRRWQGYFRTQWA